jgi:hypothetical protein
MEATIRVVDQAHHGVDLNLEFPQDGITQNVHVPLTNEEAIKLYYSLGARCGPLREEEQAAVDAAAKQFSQVDVTRLSPMSFDDFWKSIGPTFFYKGTEQQAYSAALAVWDAAREP